MRPCHIPSCWAAPSGLSSLVPQAGGQTTRTAKQLSCGAQDALTTLNGQAPSANQHRHGSPAQHNYFFVALRQPSLQAYVTVRALLQPRMAHKSDQAVAAKTQQPAPTKLCGSAEWVGGPNSSSARSSLAVSLTTTCPWPPLSVRHPRIFTPRMVNGQG